MNIVTHVFNEELFHFQNSRMDEMWAWLGKKMGKKKKNLSFVLLAVMAT